MSTTSERHIGVLKFMHPTKGYGFIVTASGENHFCHERDLEACSINCDKLKDGVTKFEYSLKADERNRKLKAVDLRIVD